MKVDLYDLLMKNASPMSIVVGFNATYYFQEPFYRRRPFTIEDEGPEVNSKRKR